MFLYISMRFIANGSLLATLSQAVPKTTADSSMGSAVATGLGLPTALPIIIYYLIIFMLLLVALGSAKKLGAKGADIAHKKGLVLAGKAANYALQGSTFKWGDEERRIPGVATALPQLAQYLQEKGTISKETAARLTPYVNLPAKITKQAIDTGEYVNEAAKLSGLGSFVPTSAELRNINADAKKQQDAEEKEAEEQKISSDASSLTAKLIKPEILNDPEKVKALFKDVKQDVLNKIDKKHILKHKVAQHLSKKQAEAYTKANEKKVNEAERGKIEGAANKAAENRFKPNMTQKDGKDLDPEDKDYNDESLENKIPDVKDRKPVLDTNGKPVMRQRTNKEVEDEIQTTNKEAFKKMDPKVVMNEIKAVDKDGAETTVVPALHMQYGQYKAMRDDNNKFNSKEFIEDMQKAVLKKVNTEREQYNINNAANQAGQTPISSTSASYEPIKEFNFIQDKPDYMDPQMWTLLKGSGIDPRNK